MGIKASINGFKGYYYMIKGNRENAEKYLSSAYELGSEKPAYLVAYGALLMQNGEYEKCMGVFDKALENSYNKPGFIPSIQSSIITCKYKLGNIEDALKDAEELWGDVKNGITYVLYGYLLMKSGRIDEALKINLEAFEYDEDDVAICDNLAQTYYNLNDKENAKKYFEKAVSIKYNMVDSCYFLAEIMTEEGNFQRAYELLDDIKDMPLNALSSVTKEDIMDAYEKAERYIKDNEANMNKSNLSERDEDK